MENREEVKARLKKIQDRVKQVLNEENINDDICAITLITLNSETDISTEEELGAALEIPVSSGMQGKVKNLSILLAGFLKYGAEKQDPVALGLQLLLSSEPDLLERVEDFLNTKMENGNRNNWS